MRRFRDIFYINAYPDENKIIYYGMEFIDFLKYAPAEINQLLLLESEYYGTNSKSKTNFEIVEKDDMEDFLAEDITNYGDFCWVDFNSREDVEKFEPIEIAELLYLGHMMKPLKSPFFDKIKIDMLILLMTMDGCADYIADIILTSVKSLPIRL